MEQTGLSKYVAWLPAVFISQGLIHLYFYYDSFGIQIHHFLEFTEVLVSFTEILGLMTLIFVGTVIFYSILGRDMIAETVTLKYKLKKEQNFWKRVCIELHSNRIYYIGSLLSATFLIFYSIYLDLPITGARLFKIFAYFIILLGAFFLNEIDRFSKSDNLNTVSKELFGLTPIFIIISLTTYYLTKFKTYDVKNFGKNFGVVIYFDNGKVHKSDSVNYYIGNTKNYVFIHHKKENNTDVFKMENVKQITYPLK